MNIPDEQVARALAEQAQNWYANNRDRNLSLEQRREFLAWLRMSPTHVREYLAIAQVGSDLRGAVHLVKESAEELIAAANSESDLNVVSLAGAQLARTAQSPGTRSLEAQTAGIARNQARWTPRVLLAAAASMAAIGFGVWLSMSKIGLLHEEYRTVHGEQRIVRLGDGSVMHLNSDSAVRVDFSKVERRIAMERGQALFKVAKDKTRPFRVRAGETEVVAVGTEFDVRRHDRNQDVVVTVVEGAVTVAKMDQKTTGESEPLRVAYRPVRLGAGQQARVLNESQRPTDSSVRKQVDVRAVDVRPAVAWVQQQVMFEREPLQDVVREFNRYGAMPIVIEDPDLVGLRISGIFNAYDLESFVGYLEQVNGIAVQRDVDRIRISIIKTTKGE
jgi:transmembrane sensor